MSRPPGCSFLGAQAITTSAWIGEYRQDLVKIIIDSGADITLISQSTLTKLKCQPKVKTGQKINLIQVTGSSTITGYVSLPIFFDTTEGPVEINVEAYIVKGMTTPFILGNNFADQYAISVIRSEDSTQIEFGSTGRFINVKNSIGQSLTDSNGQVFKVKALGDLNEINKRGLEHKKSRKSRKKLLSEMTDFSVRATEDTVIPPESIKSIKIHFNFPEGVNDIYIEKLILSN